MTERELAPGVVILKLFQIRTNDLLSVPHLDICIVYFQSREIEKISNIRGEMVS